MVHFIVKGGVKLEGVDGGGAGHLGFKLGAPPRERHWREGEAISDSKEEALSGM
jgi:hypothetical protein